MTEQKRILIAVMITSFIGPFMGSSVNIAVPAMAEDFNMMPDELTWAVTAFFYWFSSHFITLWSFS